MAPPEPKTSLANAYSSQDADTATHGACFGGEPMHYERHNYHYHPVWGEGTSTSAAEPWLRELVTPDAPTTRKPGRAKAKRRVDFVHDSPESITPPAPTVKTKDLSTPLPKLERGLQVPSRMGTITSGFRRPPILAAYGVSKLKWKLFTRELKGYARMSGKQFGTYVGWNIVYGVCWSLVLPAIGGIPATLMGHKLHKKIELENFVAAQDSGAFDSFTKRWNEDYFEPLGLRVVIAIPGNGTMKDMDVASSKLFRYQQKVGTTAPMPGAASKGADRKEERYQIKEGHSRVKAAHRARIIVMPYGGSATGDGAQQESGQVDIREYFESNVFSTPPERNATDEGSGPDFVPGGRQAALASTTPRPKQGEDIIPLDS